MRHRVRRCDRRLGVAGDIGGVEGCRYVNETGEDEGQDVTNWSQMGQMRFRS
jgi:hypothetical protein